jgi:hypothetical protein
MRTNKRINPMYSKTGGEFSSIELESLIGDI